jgi:hypothetical protein
MNRNATTGLEVLPANFFHPYIVYSLGGRLPALARYLLATMSVQREPREQDNLAADLFYEGLEFTHTR